MFQIPFPLSARKIRSKNVAYILKLAEIFLKNRRQGKAKQFADTTITRTFLQKLQRCEFLFRGHMQNKFCIRQRLMHEHEG